MIDLPRVRLGLRGVGRRGCRAKTHCQHIPSRFYYLRFDTRRHPPEGVGWSKRRRVGRRCLERAGPGGRKEGGHVATSNPGPPFTASPFC